MSYKPKPSLGIAIVIVGALTLVAAHLCKLNHHNAALIAPLAIIIVGIALHIALLKHGNRY